MLIFTFEQKFKMSFEIQGKLHKKFDTEQKTDSFKAREFVIETDGQYPQFVKFQATQDRCDLIENYEEGQEIKVSFDLRGREWQGKYFTNLNAWRVSGAEQAQAQPVQQESPPVGEPPVQANEELDDLPF